MSGYYGQNFRHLSPEKIALGSVLRVIYGWRLKMIGSADVWGRVVSPEKKEEKIK
jgi:hypothetical protein